MADLSRTTGLPVATIKFYLREGLLHPGERTNATQARYDDSHVQRLRFVRALIEVGHLSVAQVREVLTALDGNPLDALSMAQESMTETVAYTEEDSWAWAEVQELVDAMGWRVWPDSAAAGRVREVLITARRSGHTHFLDSWRAYAEAADRVAKADIDRIAQNTETERVVEEAVVGTVLGGAYLSALRMLAHQHYSGVRWGAPPHLSSELPVGTPPGGSETAKGDR